jgi:Putative MetA-pathway of phenol degradation
MIPRLLLAAFLMFWHGAIFAVSPLVVDDADTVDPGRLQLNAGWQVSRTGPESLFSLPINPVLGLNSRGELGATFGYLWQRGPSEANGVADVTIETKWHLWHILDDKFKVGARFDLKIPTASENSGLGTGNWDTGVVLIATREWGRTSVDWNVVTR